MKNPNSFLTKDGISDATLLPAARDMYELLKQINREAGIVGNESLFYATDNVLSKARGEI